MQTTRFALRAAALLAVAAYAPSLWAQVDCSADFNCGRVAWGEYTFGGDVDQRLWTQNLDGTNRTLLLNGGFASGSNFRLVRFDDNSRKIYFAINSSTFSSNVYSINVDGTGLLDITDSNCRNDEYRLSRDGTRMAVRRNCGPTDQDDKIWLMNVDGTDQHILTTAPIVSSDPTGNKHDSPSFSPDGTRVVFTSQDAAFGSRQVYRSSLDGLTVVALTNTDTDGFKNDDPVYLPNGNIVFISARDAQGAEANDIYRMNGDGGQRLRLTTMPGRKGNVVVSPDGTRILFTNRADPDRFVDSLYIMPADGGTPTRLYDDTGADDVGLNFPQFSPDGARVIFSLCYSVGGGCRSVTRTMRLDGSDAVTYENPDASIGFSAFGRPDVDGDGVIDGADSCPSVPNGYRVLVELESLDVWTMNYDGTQQVRLTPTGVADVHPRYDASARRVVFSSNRVGNDYEVFIMNADGTGATRLTTTAGKDEEPVISPDGTKIAFLGTRPPPAENFDRNVWIMNADGSNPIRLTTNQGFDGRANNPVFNVDGTRIMFDTVRNLLTGNNNEIYAIRTDGSDELRLTNSPGYDGEASYSRDGNSIVFISNRDGAAQNGEIYIMRADGTNPRRVTQTTFREQRPAFSPDGARIVFTANYSGSVQVWTMNVDGTGLRRVSTATSFVRPTLAPQPDSDGDGIGDPCDTSFDAATATGTNVTTSTPGGSVTFPQVTSPGTTSFAPITVAPGDVPAGFTLCATCTAYEITTTASYVPPLEVCLAVPASVAQGEFLALRLLHGENGVFVDRTTRRIDAPEGRQVCGEVTSLSPFALATFTAPADPLIFGSGFE